MRLCVHVRRLTQGCLARPQLESTVRTDCVLATTTTAFSIAEVASGCAHPERVRLHCALRWPPASLADAPARRRVPQVVGTHHFFPVPRMPVVEVAAHAGTSAEAVALALRMVRAQERTPLLVKDVPGFFINRCVRASRAAPHVR